MLPYPASSLRRSMQRLFRGNRGFWLSRRQLTILRRASLPWLSIFKGKSRADVQFFSIRFKETRKLARKTKRLDYSLEERDSLGSKSLKYSRIYPTAFSEGCPLHAEPHIPQYQGKYVWKRVGSELLERMYFLCTERRESLFEPPVQSDPLAVPMSSEVAHVSMSCCTSYEPHCL